MKQPKQSYLHFFSSRTRHTRCSRDWSSDVCSSDLSASRWTASAPETTSDPPHSLPPLLIVQPPTVVATQHGLPVWPLRAGLSLVISFPQPLSRNQWLICHRLKLNRAWRLLATSGTTPGFTQEPRSLPFL